MTDVNRSDLLAQIAQRGYAVAYAKDDKTFFADKGIDVLSRMFTEEWKKYRTGNYFLAYPGVRQLLTRPEGGENITKVAGEWLLYQYAINTDWKMFNVGHFLYNWTWNKPTKVIKPGMTGKQERIICAGNEVRIDKIVHNSAHIIGLNIKDKAPDPNLVNHIATPWLIQTQTAVHVSGLCWAQNYRFTVFTTKEEGWIHLDELSPVPVIDLWAPGNPSNQAVINAFERRWPRERYGELYWDKLVQAVDEDFAYNVMDKHRNGLYFYNRGPTRGQMNLPAADKLSLLPYLLRI